MKQTGWSLLVASVKASSRLSRQWPAEIGHRRGQCLVIHRIDQHSGRLIGHLVRQLRAPAGRALEAQRRIEPVVAFIDPVEDRLSARLLAQ
jgi:hypothetical protein